MSRPARAVFRLPGVALIIPFLLFVCVTPLANAGAAFWLALYVLPALGLAYIALTRTVADAQEIRTTGLLGNRRFAWAELDGLEFHGPRWAIAVGIDGRRLRLPMVRPRDLPRLAEVSGGRLLLGRDAPVEPDSDTPVGLDSDTPAEPDGDSSVGLDGDSSVESETERVGEAAKPATPAADADPARADGRGEPAAMAETADARAAD